MKDLIFAEFNSSRNHLPETFSSFVFFFKIKKVKYIPTLIAKNITHEIRNVKRSLVKKLIATSKKKNVATIDKNDENSLLKTVLNENSNSPVFSATVTSSNKVN
ncbi:MAG: hypothetical protein L6404_00935 [Candidatus Omnitrophica bacterium]|nr:hypothetical protein [Candidatus Omnitrophota bacterium]